MQPPNLWLSHAIFAVAIVLPAMASAADPAMNDAKGIVGDWQCTAATFNGEAEASLSGAVYRFLENGELQIQDSEHWSRWQYRLNATTKPKQLWTRWAGGKERVEIYELTKDRLRIRTADEPQSLSFERAPRGNWNDLTFQRISAADAEAQIKSSKRRPRMNRERRWSACSASRQVIVVHSLREWTRGFRVGKPRRVHEQSETTPRCRIDAISAPAQAMLWTIVFAVKGTWMFRITLREALLFTTIIAAGFGFWLERQENVRLRSENRALNDSLKLVTATLEEAMDHVPRAIVPIYGDEEDVRVRPLPP